MAKVRIAMSFDESVIKKIDEIRGLIPRSTLANKILVEGLDEIEGPINNI